MTGGGDAPEAYEVVLEHCTKNIWKKDAQKVLVLIGDDEPHKKEYAMNKRNIEWKVVTQKLATMGVKIYPIQCLYNTRASYFYKHLAEHTDGIHLRLSNLSNMPDMFTYICLRAANMDEFDKFRLELAKGSKESIDLIYSLTQLAYEPEAGKDDLAKLAGLVTEVSQGDNNTVENKV
eukprot:UN23897